MKNLNPICVGCGRSWNALRENDNGSPEAYGDSSWVDDRFVCFHCYIEAGMPPGSGELLQIKVKRILDKQRKEEADGNLQNEEA